jgi:hypothetical protein
VLTGWRRFAVPAAAVVGLGLAAWQLDTHYPIGHWLFWVYLQIWLLVTFWAAACVAAGDAILRRTRGLVFPLGEHLLYAFAIGLLAFTTGIFVIGLFGGLGPVTFVLWPLAMLASGVVPLARFGRRVLRRLRSARARPGVPRRALTDYAIFFFGAVGVLALYLDLLTPANLGYDSRWYHLAIAEHYATSHAVTRFAEGWFEGTWPQLATHVYTWAFMAPRSPLFFQIELAAHLEFVIFLATLAAIPLAVRWLLEGLRVPLAWAAVFLFPGIFVYDAMLISAADHVLAFWAVPVLLAAARFRRTWSAGDAALLGAMAAGAALTKYQALYVLVPCGLAAGIWTVQALWRRRPPWSALKSPLVGAALFLALTSVHWLKNLFWYGDPLYPWMHGLFRARPWNPDVDLGAVLQQTQFKPSGTFPERVLESLGGVATFSFKAHDWAGFHKDWPVFGFLFVLTLPFLFFLRGARRLRITAAAALVGVFVWYWTSHEDRYLQALLPWMAAVVAAVIWRLWRAGWVARLSVSALCALQIIWGGDHATFPTHAMAGQSTMRISMDLIASGFAGRYAERFSVSGSLVDAGKSLPPHAKVLVHEQHLRLGLGAPAVSDSFGTQGAITYRRARSPRDVWQQLRALGVTHVFWPASPMGLERSADELVFYDFVTHHLPAARRFGDALMAPLGATPPSDRPYGAVAIAGCQVVRKVSLTEVEPEFQHPGPPLAPAEIAAAFKDVDFVMLESGCRGRFPPLSGFDLVTTRNGWESWSRRR